MKVTYTTRYLKKRVPLAISRGIHTGSENLFVSVSKGDVNGWGEMSPGSSEGAETPSLGELALTEFLSQIDADELSIDEIYDLAREHKIPSCALAALDMALWDLHGKQTAQPLYKLINSTIPTVPTSVTIGICSPDVVAERVARWLDGTGVRSLKIKLGSPDGIDADKAMFSQVVESVRRLNVKLRVDANGGWDVPQAIEMMKWIAGRGADYIEQPLKEGAEEGLPALYKNRPLPIFIDESCRYSEDVGKWAHCIDGVNLKLMKCGGITGALRIVDAAKKHKLKTMIGCMGESSMSIAAGAAVSGLLDHIDLDSHLNLDPDPCIGVDLVDGVVVPNDLPGHGAALKPQHTD